MPEKHLTWTPTSAAMPLGGFAMMDREFLEVTSSMQSEVEHDTEKCGTCCQRLIMAGVAQEMLEKGDLENAVEKWAKEIHRRWDQTKFARLWREEQEAGRDPLDEFAKRGWEV